MEGRGIFFTFVNYYAVFIPDLFNMSSSFVFCLSCFFAIASLEKNSQLIAIHASGISIFRIISLLLCLAFFIGLIQTLNNCVLIPKSTKIQILNGWSKVKFEHHNTLNYTDPTSLWQRIKQPIEYSSGISNIHLEGLDLKSKKFDSVHAMLMDENSTPLLKIIGKEGHWNDQDFFSANNVIIFSYQLSSGNLIHLPELKWSSKLPLENIYFSKVTKSSLTYGELLPFSFENTYKSERFNRLVDGFLPFLMMLFTCSIVIPLIHHRPYLAYLSCLILSLFLFLSYATLKTKFESDRLGYIFPILIISSFCISTFVYRLKKIPS